MSAAPYHEGVKLALVQINPTVGDIRGNADQIIARARAAAEAGADLAVFSELVLSAYPPRDLLLQEGFLDAIRREAKRIAESVPASLTVMVGSPWRPDRTADEPDSWDERARLSNSILVMKSGRITHRYDKRLLPTYDVFDEDRYFAPGNKPVVVDVAGVRVGLSLCEDLWRGSDVHQEDRYTGQPDPVDDLVRAGATLIINPSGSPFVLGKGRRQRDILIGHVRRTGIAVAAVNQVGGNDDLIFDGHGAVYVASPTTSEHRHDAKLVAAAPGFVEHTLLVDFPRDVLTWRDMPEVADPLLDTPDTALLWHALVLGVRDYCRKTGFKRVVLGVSGGIDSALTATIASAALGPTNVLGVAMPGRYSSPGSLIDAHQLARNLGIEYVEAPISEPHGVMSQMLQPVYRAIGADGQEYRNDLTDENLQSRLRGITTMAISNKTGALLLTTGNKSELAVGYCTLYGDMNGGLAVLSDVTKADVYRLSNWINAHPQAGGFTSAPIPESSITKPPSAELRPDQTDQDTLPPYDVLDEVVDRYVEYLQSPSRIIRETGFDEALVKRITRMIDNAEFKRKQMPIGLKVTSIAFGRGRRRAIAQRFTE